MHEVMVAQRIFEIISAEAAKQKTKPVLAKISCGILNAINDDALSFAFEAIAKGTNCENIKLQIEHKPIQAKCEHCATIFEFEFTNPSCTNCNSNDYSLLPDEPLLIETIEFESE